MESTTAPEATSSGSCARSELKVTGDQLLATVRKLVHEGQYRRIIIRNDAGHTLVELPLTLGVVGALLAPVWAAIGAMAAMASGFSLIVERHDNDAAPHA